MDSEAVPAAPLAEWLQAPPSAAHSVPTRPHAHTQTHTIGTQQLGYPAPFDTHTHTLHTQLKQIALTNANSSV